MAIEAPRVLCDHASAALLRKVPDDYSACFVALGEAGIVPGVLAQRLQSVARFAHVEGRLDPEQVREILLNDLNDLRHFASHMVAWL